jgi:hypothetical protein
MGQQPKLHRDASNRLFASFDAEASSYGRLVARVSDEFGLQALGSRIEGLEEIFQDYAQGGLKVGLEWDVWMGFQVVAKSPESEALVTAIARFLANDKRSR